MKITMKNAKRVLFIGHILRYDIVRKEKRYYLKRR